MQKIIFITLLLLTMICFAHAQTNTVNDVNNVIIENGLVVVNNIVDSDTNQFSGTNEWYIKGDFTISLFGTTSIHSLVDKHNLYGISLEATYWQSEYTGTSVELGDFNIKNFNPELIDHISVLEKVRVIPFNPEPVFRRLDIVGITGTDTRLSDGSKGIVVGVGSEWAFTKNLRASVEVKEYFESIATDSTLTAALGLEYKF